MPGTHTEIHTLPGSITGEAIPQQVEDIIATYGEDFVDPGNFRVLYRFTDYGERYGELYRTYSIKVYGYVNKHLLGMILETQRIDEFSPHSLFPLND